METTILEALTAGVSAKTGAPITLSTARNYWRMVNNLFLKIHPGAEMKNMAWTKKWDEVEPAVNAYAESTQVSVINAVCAVLRKVRGYKKVLKMYEDELAKRVGRNRAAATQEKDEKQKDYWMEWSEVIAKRDALPDGVDKVLLSLYTMMPPGRAAEYATMMVGEGENCYDPETGVMRIRKHKTAREFPDEVVQVPAELKAVLNAWLKGRTSGSLLGLPSPGAITKRLNKVFAPKKISVSALRHIYDTHHHGKAVAALKADARMMRHSVGTAMNTYVRT
jgi:integrase